MDPPPRVMLYRRLGAELEALIRRGTLRTGDRLPSVRQLCRERGISPATAQRAYSDLEASGLAETRPRSGYYVSDRWSTPTPEPQGSRPSSGSTRVAINDLVWHVLEAARDPRIVPLGSAFPAPALFPWKKLALHLGRSARHIDPRSTVQSLPPGHLDLRRSIAQRYLRFGTTVPSEEIVVTAGALEALTLSLRAITSPGDAVAVEAPAFYACLQAIESAGLKAVEIATHPREGVDLGALSQAIARHAIRACWFMTSFQNPLGATMPDEKKKALVALLAKHDIPLIEDDVYAELHHGTTRPRPAKHHDRRGLVLHCSSFSKCLAPGYRLGWVSAGRYAQAVLRAKIVSSLATSMPVQLAIDDLLRHDSYDAHLERLRTALGAQQAAMLASLRRHFPRGYRVAAPDGGYFLWLDLGASVDALELHRIALQANVSIAPGPMFSARREFRHCVRINCGHPWSATLEGAIAMLGGIVRSGAAGAV